MIRTLYHRGRIFTSKVRARLFSHSEKLVHIKNFWIATETYFPVTGTNGEETGLKKFSFNGKCQRITNNKQHYQIIIEKDAQIVIGHSHEN